jgi:uncharacterized protein (TIGR03437 family)
MRKLFCFAILTAQAITAADFVSGQAARLVIGQTSFTNNFQAATNYQIGAAAGVAYGSNRLFVVDSNQFEAFPVNNRVLIFPTDILPKPTEQVNFNVPTNDPHYQDLTCYVCARTTARVVLGQTNFNKTDVGLSATGLRTPTAVATDGTRFAVADTNNNRVLIWNSIPTPANDAAALENVPADVVIGQVDFTHNATSVPPTAKSLRGPQGVWFQNGKLFIADTQNNRVLIYNQVPTANGASADVALGVGSLTTAVPVALTVVTATASNLTSPVSVTSDGTRLFVTDLGANRILIWNSIPTSNGAPADFEIGQPDMSSALANNSSKLCASNGVVSTTDATLTYPGRCEKTLSFPRFALSDGKRLYVADGGNDRVLIYSSIPNSNGVAADLVLGQPDFTTYAPGDNADQISTPTSLAYDGTNLYVADVFNRRVLVFSAADTPLPPAAFRNAASLEVFAIGAVTLAGTIKENDTVTVTITTTDVNGTVTNTPYLYTVLKTDTLSTVLQALIKLINVPGNPNVTAQPNFSTNGIVLTAKKGGAAGQAVSYSTTLSTAAVITATVAGTSLSLNLQDAAKIAPGSLITLFGTNLSERTEAASFAGTALPFSLANTQLFVDGLPAPLTFVSPTQVSAQLPFEVADRTSVSAYLRTVHADGSITVSNPQAVSVVPANPGIFAADGTDPRPAKLYHAFTNSTGVLSIDGSIVAKDVGSIVIAGTPYTYTVLATDTLATITQAFIDMINADSNSPVTASASNVFTRILLQAKIAGPDSNGTAYSAKVTTGTGLILTALTSQLCCSSSGGLVTDDNPAVPGEILYLLATGLGPTPIGIDSGKIATTTSGGSNQDSTLDAPNTPVDSILAGGQTANILFTGYEPGLVGVFRVTFQLGTGVTTNSQTQLTIAQQFFVSNVVTFPVLAQ